jgi:hypothetical protein
MIVGNDRKIFLIPQGAAATQTVLIKYRFTLCQLTALFEMLQVHINT